MILNTPARWLSLSLAKRVTGLDDKAVGKTSGPLKFELTVPERLRKSGRTFVLLQYANGTARELAANSGSKLAFETDRPSPLALCYTGDMGTVSVEYSAKDRTVANPLAVRGAGNVVYGKLSGSPNITVNSRTGALTVRGRTPTGAYRLRLAVTTTGGSAGKAETKTAVVTVGKAAGKLEVRPAKAVQRAAYGKERRIAAPKAFKVVKNTGKGAVSYEKVSGNAKISVASNGAVTVRKGLKRGTYTVRVRATSEATGNYRGRRPGANCAARASTGIGLRDSGQTVPAGSFYCFSGARRSRRPTRIARVSRLRSASRTRIASTAATGSSAATAQHGRARTRATRTCGLSGLDRLGV